MKTHPAQTSRFAGFASFPLAFTFILLAPPLHAQDALIQPTAVTSSTSATDFFPVANLINGSGLSGPPSLDALGTHGQARHTQPGLAEEYSVSGDGVFNHPSTARTRGHSPWPPSMRLNFCRAGILRPA